MDEKAQKSVEQARHLVEAAHTAFQTVKNLDQASVDRICEAMSQAAQREAARLGAMAVEETGFGRADDKREKNRFAAEDVWRFIKSLKTVGIVRDSGSVVEIASPRGVVAGIIPSTNPTSTAIFKALIAIKSRNTIVLSPHPSAARAIAETVRILREAAIAEGLPSDALSVMTALSIEGTEELMKHKKTAVILATGGIGLVRAAYSSGKPAFGVGPGNVPVFVERTANPSEAAKRILTGTCFDNGTICASEQAVVADAPIAEALREAFRQNGGHFLNAEEAERVGNILITEQRTLNPKIVGKSAEHIANLAGVRVPNGTRCLLAECAGVGRDFAWSFEKLSPTLAFYVVNGLEEGARRCLEILQFGGMGHTAGMHTQSREAAVRFGAEMPASRIIINSPTTHGAIGFSTDLSPSMTLGCGSWGGNVTSDNVSPLHLMDVKRVAFETKPVGKDTHESVSKSSSVNAEVSGMTTNVKPIFKSPVSLSESTKSVPNRAEIAALVDRFLRQKVSAEAMPEAVKTDMPSVRINAASPEVKTIIHQYVPAQSESSSAANAIEKPKIYDFVSEDDVKRAIENGQKIFVTAKTIITPSARDLGEEKEIFAKT